MLHICSFETIVFKLRKIFKIEIIMAVCWW